MIFVFGSNEAGIHGAGAAKFALQRKGAVWKKGLGHHGQSYAIPTKDRKIQTLDLITIEKYVGQFNDFARKHPQMEFQVTQIGCGLAGLKPKDIVRMFVNSPENCLFDSAWEPLFKEYMVEKRYWGTFP